MVPFPDMTKDEMNEVEATDLSDLMAAEEGAGEPQVYEVGYHLLPTLDEAAIPGEAESLVAILKKAGAEIIGERTPAKVNLAYSIDTQIGGARQAFTSAYFGWVAFEAPTASLVSIKETFDGNEKILRFIITKTTKDQVAAVMADPGLDVGAPEPEVEVETVVGADSEGAEEAAPSEEKEGE